MDLPRPAPRAWLAPVPRPDGWLQVGLGPGSWLVDGWTPERSTHDPATALVRGLGHPVPAAPCGPGSFVVLGEGELAMRLRTVERDASEQGTSEQGTVQPAPAPHVVLVSTHLVPVGTAWRADLTGRKVLPVVQQTGRIVVGPWTGLPGAPCLHCLDLHRRDLDGAWPAVAAAFDDPSCRAEPPVHPTTVLDLAQALVLLLLGAGDLGRATGISYEVGEHAPHLVTRAWTAHPTCPWRLVHQGGRAGDVTDQA